MKRVLVTGGAGFIGSFLCRRLLDRGDSVICVDNFFTGSLENVEPLLKHPNFKLIVHDIVEPIWEDAEEIYNLASPASPIHYQFNAIKTIKTSILGSINMLGLAKRCSAKILQASTSEVYGDPIIHPQKEEYWGNVNPIGVRSCYDEGKRCAETLFFDYLRQNSVKIKVVRIFNTYGPNMSINDGRVISNLIVQALKGEPLTLYGDGLQSRSFQFVDDLIEGMVRMMATPDSITGPVNLGNPQEYTILELAQLILELTGSTSPLLYKELPQDDPKQRCPDITLAKRVLDWEPKVKLVDGLTKTIEYFTSII
ncbi:MAG: UDP-glucuronic acid decarboxylase family protein [Bacteroidales bacterium]